MKSIVPSRSILDHTSKLLSSTPRTPCHRYLATATPPNPRRPTTDFTETLNSGPSFTDFLASSSSVPDSIPGTSHLPSWLKRPIPAGGNFAKIKKDLRGLNLHTGTCLLQRP